MGFDKNGKMMQKLQQNQDPPFTKLDNFVKGKKDSLVVVSNKVPAHLIYIITTQFYYILYSND